MNSTISIIIPVYNAEKYISKCIESCIHQTYKKIEIILVDDGSTDRSSEICDKYAKLDKRIFVVHQKNQGVSIARNAGLDFCHGKYVMFVDADDYLEPNACECMIKPFELDNIDLSMFAFFDVIGDKKRLRAIDATQKIVSISSDLYDLFSHPCINMSSVWCKLYKKSLLGRFDDKYIYGEDQLFNFDYFKKINNIFVSSAPVYNYVIHESSFVRSNKTKDFELRGKLFPIQIEFAKHFGSQDLMDWFCSVYIKNFILTLYYIKLVDGKKQCKKFFQDNLAMDNLKFAIKNAKCNDLKSKISKYVLKTKQLALALAIGKLNEKNKYKWSKNGKNTKQD